MYFYYPYLAGSAPLFLHFNLACLEQAQSSTCRLRMLPILFYIPLKCRLHLQNGQQMPHAKFAPLISRQGPGSVKAVANFPAINFKLLQYIQSLAAIKFSKISVTLLDWNPADAVAPDLTPLDGGGGWVCERKVDARFDSVIEHGDAVRS